MATELTRPGQRPSHRRVAVVLRQRGDRLPAHRTTIASGLTVSRDALEAVRLRPAAFHGDWTYTILPTQSATR